MDSAALHIINLSAKTNQSSITSPQSALLRRCLIFPGTLLVIKTINGENGLCGSSYNKPLRKNKSIIYYTLKIKQNISLTSPCYKIKKMTVRNKIDYPDGVYFITSPVHNGHLYSLLPMAIRQSITGLII